MVASQSVSISAARFEAPGENGVGRIVIDRADDSVNAIGPDLVEDLGRAVRAARACASLRGLIVASGKATQFVAGADLKMVAQATDREQLVVVCRRFQAVLDELAWLPVTVVAAINGPALGGGLELALACDYRVAADLPSLRLGQPEVNLGLVPAGGGTQRLPRLIGLPLALELILNGRRLTVRRALRLGVLDEVVHPAALEDAARAWAHKPKRPLDRPLRLGLNARAAMDVAELAPAGRALIYRRARAAVLARTHGQYPAPLRALEAIEAGFEHGMAAGLEAEARACADLARTPTTTNLIWLFLATQRASRERGRVAHLGVVGAGFMGAAIADVGAVAGMTVRLKDVKPEAVAHGLSAIRKMVDDSVARRRLDTREGRRILQRVSGTTDYAGFRQADVVIEAVFEDLLVKQKVVQELEANVRTDAVIASNTSAIPIRDIARLSAHPERIVGMHFFSPAQRMPLLEVVRPAAAADTAVQAAVAVGRQMGKTVIVVGDSPGFYTSRVLGLMLNEAALLLGEGARIEDVDRAMTAFGFPVGPFVLYDEVGLDIAQHVAEGIASVFGERVPTLDIVSRLAAAGQTGRKAGAGFYMWPPPSRLDQLRRVGQLSKLVKPKSRAVNPAVHRLSGAPAQCTFDERVIQERLTLLFVGEAIRCLEEGVLQSAADGDIGAVLGLGFPPFRGGPFHYADALGLAVLVDKLRALSQTHGSRFAPPLLLVEHARAGRTFFED